MSGAARHPSARRLPTYHARSSTYPIPGRSGCGTSSAPNSLRCISRKMRRPPGFSPSRSRAANRSASPSGRCYRMHRAATCKRSGTTLVGCGTPSPLKPERYFLIRPDGHVAARRRQADPHELVHLVELASGNSSVAAAHGSMPGQAAIDGECAAGDVTRCRTCQEDDRGIQLPLLTNSGQRA